MMVGGLKMSLLMVFPPVWQSPLYRSHVTRNPPPGEVSTCRALALLRKRPEHALAEGRILIFPDLADLATFNPVDQAVVVVVALAGFGLHVAARLHHHPFIVGNEPKRHGAAVLLQQRLHVTVEIAQHDFLAIEGLRPRILPGDGHDDVIGQSVAPQRAVAGDDAGKDRLHQLLVVGCAHGDFSLDWLPANHGTASAYSSNR